MSNRIGSTFGAEIAAAGLSGIPFGFDAVTGTLTFDPSVSAADQARVTAVRDAHDPTTVAASQVNFLGFLALFTPAEQAAIVGSADPRIKLFCLMAAGATFVDLADPRVVAGTRLLEALGLIAQGRAAQVLAGQTPLAQ